MKNIPLLSKAPSLRGMSVVVRTDLNEPIKDNKVLDDFRIKKLFPTLSFLVEQGAHIRIIGHHSSLQQTLEPIARKLGETFPIRFVKTLDEEVESKDILFYENLRLNEGEEKNDEAFARKLALLGDVYINEAFAVSHRPHASIVSLPRLLPTYAGFLFEEEIKNLSKVFQPVHPFLLILGGGKVAKKFHLLRSFKESADSIFVGGALAHVFFKARGYSIGVSLFEDVGEETRELLSSDKILTPLDVKVESKDGITLKKPEEVNEDDKIQDAGGASLALLRKEIQKAKFILWNGPLGDYTVPGFDTGTRELIRLLTQSDAHTVVGGGDTVTLIAREGKLDAFGFISSGGGAMIEFLASKTLPGIKALESSKAL